MGLTLPPPPLPAEAVMDGSILAFVHTPSAQDALGNFQ